MHVPAEHASVQIKNGETKFVRNSQSWATEGKPWIVGVSAEGFNVESITEEEELARKGHSQSYLELRRLYPYGAFPLDTVEHLEAAWRKFHTNTEAIRELYVWELEQIYDRFFGAAECLGVELGEVTTRYGKAAHTVYLLDSNRKD